MISKLRLLIALVALGSLPLWAQDDNADSGKYFRTIGAGITANNLYFSLKGKDKNISIVDAVHSILYDGKGTGTLTLYKIIQGPDNKPMHVNVAQADIGKAGSLALLTFSADPHNPAIFDVQVLPDDLTSFPLGSYRIVNRSARPIKVSLGDQTADVEPNEVRLLIYPPPAKGGAVAARVYATSGSGDNAQRLLYANTWGYDDKHRTEVLISPRPGMPNLVQVSRLCDDPTILLLKQYLPKD